VLPLPVNFLHRRSRRSNTRRNPPARNCPHGRLRLAARQGESRGDRIPRSRKRLTPKLSWRRCRPARRALPGDAQPREADRRLGSLPRRRLVVLHAHRRRKAIRRFTAARPGTAQSGPTRTRREQVDSGRQPAWPRVHAFFAIGATDITDDGRWLAYTTDTTGFRQYTLHIKDLATGETLPGEVERVGSVVWAADNLTLFTPWKTRSRSGSSSCGGTRANAARLRRAGLSG
jgi:hypothetical protein